MLWHVSKGFLLISLCWKQLFPTSKTTSLGINSFSSDVCSQDALFRTVLIFMLTKVYLHEVGVFTGRSWRALHSDPLQDSALLARTLLLIVPVLFFLYQ